MGDDELSKALLMDDKDMEDNLQYRSAISAGCEVIVTRNVKDFPADGISWIHWLKILLTRTKKKLMMMVKKTSDLFYFTSLREQ